MIIREINQPTASAPSFVDFPVDFSLWIPKILVINSGFNCEEGLFVFEEISARYTSEGSRVSKERPPITLTTTKHQQNTNNTAYAANPLESNLKQTFRPPNWDRKKISRPTTKPKRRSRSFSFCGKPFSRLVLPGASRPLSHTTNPPIRQLSPSTSILLADTVISLLITIWFRSSRAKLQTEYDGG